MRTTIEWDGPAPKVGQYVKVPQTTPGHDVPTVGTMQRIRSVGTSVCRTPGGTPYVWVGLKPGSGVWASHLLGYRIKQ